MPDACEMNGESDLFTALQDEAVSDEIDYNQLHSVSASAKEAPGVKTIGAVADRGYHNYSGIKKCTDADTVPFVPAPRSETGRKE